MDQWAREQIAALEQRVASLERQVLGEAGAAAARPPAADADPEIEGLLRDGKELQAIKAYIDRTGSDLATAKTAIAQIQARL